MKPIRVGVIGAGWGQLQIEAFRRVKGVDVASLCEINDEVADKLKTLYNLRNVYKDYRQLLASDVELVSVAAPPSIHAEIINAAIEAGKHILTEKPVALDARTTQTLAGKAHAKGIVHAVDYEMRFLPANTYIKELVDEDYVGRIHRVDVTMTMEHPWGEHGNWAVDLARGGGVLLELGAHFLDLLRWWFGDISSVVAGSRTHFPTIRVKNTMEKVNGKSSAITVTGDDAFWCTMQFASGGEATVNFLTGARHDPGWSIGIYGSSGSFVNKSGQLWSMRDGDREMGLLPIPKRLELDTNPNDPLMWSMAKLIERVAARIRGAPDALPFPTFQDSLAVERLVEAIRTSSSEQRWVDVAK